MPGFASTTLVIKVVTDTQQSVDKLAQHGRSTSRWAAGMRKAAVPALAVGTAAIAAADMVLDAASAHEQAMGAVDSVFGKSAAVVKGWAATAAESVGLAASEYANMASLIGSQLGNLGVPQDQVLSKTRDLITMGADLAATYGGTTAQAVEALSAALRGETDPIERYAVRVNDASIKARMLADGTSKLTGAAANAARTNALLALVQKQGANTAGQFARESGSLAGQQQRASAQFENAKAAIGEALLPAMSKLASILGAVAKAAQKHPKLFTALIVAVLAVAAAVMVMNVALAITALVSAPVTLTVLAIVAAVLIFVAVIVLLWKKCAWFRNAVIAAWNAIKVAAVKVWGWLKVYISMVVTVIVAVFKALLAAGKWVIRALTAYWRLLGAVIRIVASVISAIFRGIVAAGRWLWAGIVAYLRAIAIAWAWVRSAIAAAANFIRARIFVPLRAAVGVIAAAFLAAKAVMVRAFQLIVSGISAAVGQIRAIFLRIKGQALDWLVSAFRSAKDTISGIWNSIVGTIESVIGRIRGLIDGLMDKIRSIKSVAGKIPGLGAILHTAPPPAPTPTATTAGARSTGTGGRSQPAADPFAGATFQLILDGQVVERAVTKVTVRQNRILARRILNGRPAQ